jgi:hypothetical protein
MTGGMHMEWTLVIVLIVVICVAVKEEVRRG